MFGRCFEASGLVSDCCASVVRAVPRIAESSNDAVNSVFVNDLDICFSTFRSLVFLKVDPCPMAL